MDNVQDQQGLIGGCINANSTHNPFIFLHKIFESGLICAVKCVCLSSSFISELTYFRCSANFINVKEGSLVSGEEHVIFFNPGL